MFIIIRKGRTVKRNEVMVDLADEILVVWDGVSNGTEYTIEYAKKKNKCINVIKTGVGDLKKQEEKLLQLYD